MVRFCSRLFVVVALLASASQAQASVLFSTGANAQGLSATASFSISGGLLTIVLTNTDTAPSASQWAPSELLTGLFFNLGSAAYPLAQSSATIAAGSLYNAGTCNPGPCNASTTNVGGEWGYGYNASGYFGGGVGTQGISSSNAYVSGDGDMNGANLDGPTGLSGVYEFGILPANLGGAAINSTLASDPTVRGAVTFVLDIPNNLTEQMISNVSFTYGKHSTDPHIYGGTGGTGNSVPEPALLSLLGVALAAAGYRLRQRRVS